MSGIEIVGIAAIVGCVIGPVAIVAIVFGGKFRTKIRRNGIDLENER